MLCAYLHGFLARLVSMNILVADDDSAIRFLVSSALSELGHNVDSAENGYDAWTAWKRDHHQLAIFDWTMPGLEGLELCRRIRFEQSQEFTYIILITARPGRANYLEAMDSGVDDFISKPFETEQLLAHVRVATRILGLHENLRLANTELERRVCERTAELEEALRAKGEFLSRASHELRTPMNHILGFAQVLQLKGLSAEQEANVQQIITSGRHLLTLIDRVLGVSKSSPDDLSFLATSKACESVKEA